MKRAHLAFVALVACKSTERNVVPAAEPLPVASASAEPEPPPTPPPVPPSSSSVRLYVTDDYRCSNNDRTSEIKVTPRANGARIAVSGQGPCPGESPRWAAEMPKHLNTGKTKRIQVRASGGTPSRCLCHGTGTFDLGGLAPGEYDVEISGGFNRRIMTLVVVP